MRRGDVVLVPVAQTDGQVKPRPAVLLKEVPPFGDWLLCPISTQLRHEVEGVDVIIGNTHPDFVAMKLKQASLVRLSQVQVIQKTAIRGAMGAVSADTLAQFIGQLVRWLQS